MPPAHRRDLANIGLDGYAWQLWGVRIVFDDWIYVYVDADVKNRPIGNLPQWDDLLSDLEAAFRIRFIADDGRNELQKSGGSNSRKQIVRLSSRSISAGNLVFFVLTKGMSLIGPRPERPAFCAELEKRIHGWHYRTMVTPGLSGLAQVTGGYDLLPKEKVVLDLWEIGAF